MLTYGSDIIVADETGIIAEVEVRNAVDVDLTFASAVMEDRAREASRDGTRFLMLVSQDKAFLWRLGDHAPLADADVWEFEVRPFLEPYTKRLAAGTRLRHEELMAIVWAWLGDLADREANVAIEAASPLVASGLIAAIRSGPAVVTMAESR